MDISFLDVEGFWIGVGSSLLATLVWEFLRRRRSSPWSRFGGRSLRPGLHGAEDLDRLVKLLYDVYSWLGSNDSPRIKSIQDELSTVAMKLSTVQLTYMARFSEKSQQQTQALRKLVEIDPDGAREVLQKICEDPDTTEMMRAYAQKLLDEIDRRTKGTNS